MTSTEPSFDLATLSARYRSHALTVIDLAAEVERRIDATGDDHVWIARVPAAEIKARAADLDNLLTTDPEAARRLPLFGIPFAVKDNIDVAGMPTTAGCPAFAYVPAAHAPAVAALLDAGAVLIGKTNMDQFATGLVGVRSPYGVARNPFDARYIPGGSSSGSAVAVAAGLVSFALGTDTAGSGRVPASFNNIVGLKPTRGRISARGVVPACRTLDCVSIFALSCDDAARILDVCGTFDGEDPFSRRRSAVRGLSAAPLRFAVPTSSELEFFGDEMAAALFADAIAAMEQIGGLRVEMDFGPFREVAQLLYSGPWVAERLAAIETLFAQHPDALLPVTRQVIGGGAAYRATDAFKANYRLAALRRITEPLWDRADVLLLPTTGTIYTVAAVEAEPLTLNTNLGYYTNFANLLDLAGIAVPAGFRGNGLPFGVSLMAPAFSDEFLAVLGAKLQRRLDLPLGATPHRLPPAEPAASLVAGGRVEIAVVGAHLSGMPLNRELTERDGKFVRHAHTAPTYRLYALDADPPRPGLVRVREGGHAIALEIWSLDIAAFGSFVANVTAPLAIGTLTLDDGREVKGFLCEADAVRGAEDISEFGGWREYRSGRK